MKGGKQDHATQNIQVCDSGSSHYIQSHFKHFIGRFGTIRTNTYRFWETFHEFFHMQNVCKNCIVNFYIFNWKGQKVNFFTLWILIVRTDINDWNIYKSIKMCEGVAIESRYVPSEYQKRPKILFSLIHQFSKRFVEEVLGNSILKIYAYLIAVRMLLLKRKMISDSGLFVH